MALEHTGEAIAHLPIGDTDCERSRDVGRAVEILRSGIDEEERPRLDLPIRGRADAVMDHGPIGAGACDGRKAEVPKVLALSPERGEALGGRHFRESPLHRFPLDPGEEARERRTVAAMSCADALDRKSV